MPTNFRRETLEIIEGYSKQVRTGLPFVTAKFAMSLDGKIATYSGESQWITGEIARQRAHDMRAMSEAVVLGAGTVLKDNPRLTARDDRGEHTGRPVMRVVVDTNGRIPTDSRVFAESGKVIWAIGNGSEVESPGGDIEVVNLPTRGRASRPPRVDFLSGGIGMSTTRCLKAAVRYSARFSTNVLWTRWQHLSPRSSSAVVRPRRR